MRGAEPLRRSARTRRCRPRPGGGSRRPRSAAPSSVSTPSPVPRRVAGQLDAGHLVAGALVVDERARAELADREEPRPLQVVAVAAAPPRRRRDVGGQRQPREGVAGQEALARRSSGRSRSRSAPRSVSSLRSSAQLVARVGARGARPRSRSPRSARRGRSPSWFCSCVLGQRRPVQRRATGRRRRRTRCGARATLVVRPSRRTTSGSLAGRCPGRRSSASTRSARCAARAGRRRVGRARCQTSGSSRRLGLSPPASSRSVMRATAVDCPVSASQIACTWERTRSSLARSRRGGGDRAGDHLAASAGSSTGRARCRWSSR